MLAPLHEHLWLLAFAFNDEGAPDLIPRLLLANAECARLFERRMEGIEAASEALRLAQRSGMRLVEADARLLLARLAWANRDVQEARAHAQAARALVQETGYARREKEVETLEQALWRLP